MCLGSVFPPSSKRANEVSPERSVQSSMHGPPRGRGQRCPCPRTQHGVGARRGPGALPPPSAPTRRGRQSAAVEGPGNAAVPVPLLMPLSGCTTHLSVPPPPPHPTPPPPHTHTHTHHHHHYHHPTPHPPPPTPHPPPQPPGARRAAAGRLPKQSASLHRQQVGGRGRTTA